MVRHLYAGVVGSMLLLALGLALLYVPTEPTMRMAQRIFYFHVPAAITTFAAFAVVCVASIGYLRTADVRWDRVAAAAAELGLLFALMVLITGPIWAKPVWGVYWRWEPRLTSMLVLFSMDAGYLMVRAYGTDPGRTPRLAAVLGIVAFANVPLVHFSVRLWSAEQQLHPREVTLEPRMQMTLWISIVAFALLFVFLLQRRYALAAAADAVEDLQQQLDGLSARPGDV